MRIFFSILTLLVITSASASECFKTRYLDLESTKKINQKSYASGEKEQRDFVIFSNGDFLILNQHHCINSNYEIRYFFGKKSNVSYQNNSDQILNLLDKIVELEGLAKKKGFDGSFIEGLKTGEFNKDNLEVKKIINDEFVEYDFQINKNYDYPYNHEVYIYLGVGSFDH